MCRADVGRGVSPVFFVPVANGGILSILPYNFKNFGRLTHPPAPCGSAFGLILLPQVPDQVNFRNGWFTTFTGGANSRPRYICEEEAKENNAAHV